MVGGQRRRTLVADGDCRVDIAEMSNLALEARPSLRSRVQPKDTDDSRL
jgi:hypothetical protein